MKNTAILALVCAAPVLAGTPQVVTTAPVAPVVSPWSVEIGAGYNFAARDLYRHDEGSSQEVDTYGVDLTACYALNEKHSLNLTFGYTYGDKADPEVRSWDTHARSKATVHTFTLMPGYRYTHALTDKVSAYAGVNVGIANLSLKDHFHDDEGCIPSHDAAWGVAYAAECGLRYALSPRTEVFAAYRFSGNTCRPVLSGGNYADTEVEEDKIHRQFYNGVRTGVSIKF